MKGFASVYRKELYVLFASRIFYTVAFMFTLIGGYFFYSALAYYNIFSFQASQNPMMAKQLNIMDMVMRPFFGDISIVLLLLSPLLTMRLYAEERKSGTLELLFTYPLTDQTTLLAKWTAVMTAYIVLLAGTLPSVALLGYLGKPEWKPIFCGYLGLVLMGGSFMSLGILTSSLTENQIVAAVSSFGALLMFWIIGWARNLVGPGTGAFFEYISITKHLDTFTKGVLDSRDLIYYLLFISFFLFLTLRQMGSCRWRG